MPSNFPTSLDSFTTGTLTGVVSGADHGNKADAINKIEAELGVAPSGAFATVAARLTAGGIVNVKDPQFAGGAVGNGIADDTAAIQAAIDFCVGGSDSSVRRSAIAELYIPAGAYRVTNTLNVRNVWGFTMRGAGIFVSTFIVSGTTMAAASLFDFNGFALSRVGGFGIRGEEVSTSHRVTNAIHVHWDMTAGLSSTTMNKFHNIGIYDLYFVNGIALELDNTSAQADNALYEQIFIGGGNTGVGTFPYDATYWQAGIRIGNTSSISGNTFQNHIHQAQINGCKRGIHCNGSDFRLQHAEFNGNQWDISAHACWRKWVIEDVRFENSERLFMNEIGENGNAATLTIRDVWWSTVFDLNADREIIVHKQAGTMTIADSSFTAENQTPLIRASGGGAQIMVDINNVACETAADALFVNAADANHRYTFGGYVQLNNNLLSPAATFGDSRIDKLSVVEGSNKRMGVATLVAGTVTVSTTAVTANSRIMMTGQNSSGTAGELTVSARTAGTSFTITSASGTDTRSVAWMLVEPA